jgi:putative hemolysin
MVVHTHRAGIAQATQHPAGQHAQSEPGAEEHPNTPNAAYVTCHHTAGQRVMSVRSHDPL